MTQATDEIPTQSRRAGTRPEPRPPARASRRRQKFSIGKPFIYLSAGVSNAEFSETLELAGETGVKFNGVLCGRATWKEGIPVYAKQGAAAFRKWLETEGVKNIENVNQKLKTATSWFPIYNVEPAMAGA